MRQRGSLVPLLGLWVLAEALGIKLAQAVGGAGPDLNWGFIAASYGVAAPFVIYLLINDRRKDKINDELRARNDMLSDNAIERIAPLTADVAGALREAGQEIRDLMMERNRLQQAPAEVDRIDKLANRMEDLVRRLDSGER